MTLLKQSLKLYSDSTAKIRKNLYLVGHPSPLLVLLTVQLVRSHLFYWIYFSFHSQITTTLQANYMISKQFLWANVNKHSCTCLKTSLPLQSSKGWKRKYQVSKATQISRDKVVTHPSWGQNCHQLQSSCPVKPGRRIRPAAEPEGEGVRSGFHHPLARGLPDHCHCSFPGSHRGGEM